MNYIKQLNAFYDWVLRNPITPKQQALYLAILNMNNKCGWKKEFSIPNQTLQALCPMVKSELHKIRNELKQMGLIDYKKGKKNQAGIYTISSLYETNLETNVETNFETNVETNFETNNRDITKHKQNEIKNTKKEYENAFNEIWKEYPKKTDKQAAKKKFMTKAKQEDEKKDGVGLEGILSGTRAYIAEMKNHSTEKQFIKNYATFLNKESYRDYTEESSPDVELTEEQKQEKELYEVDSILSLGRDYYKMFGDVEEYERALERYEELKAYG